MTANDLRSKSPKELNEELHALLREQFNMRMQAATGQLTQTHQFGRVRKDIARIRTVLNEKSNTESSV